jgi:hypothetical protein
MNPPVHNEHILIWNCRGEHHHLFIIFYFIVIFIGINIRREEDKLSLRHHGFYQLVFSNGTNYKIKMYQSLGFSDTSNS